MDVLLAIAAGLGLAAACGFRVFVPLLLVSIAGRAEMLTLHEDFAWVASLPALVGFSVATALEIAGYYVPVVDNLLDTVATPAAAVAGAVVALAVVVDVDPWLRWSLAIVAGAGLATVVQLPTTAVRAGSTATTAGVGNPLVSTGEVGTSLLLSGIAILVPILVPIGIALVVWWVVRRRRRARAVAA